MTIEPALTAAEWEEFKEDWADDPVEGVVARLAYPEPRAHPIEGVALLNFALPDDDPRKITKEKISKLTQAAHFLAEQKGGQLSTVWPDGANPWHDLADDLRQFATELAALLPPED